MSDVVKIEGLEFGWSKDQPIVLDIPSLVIKSKEKVFLKGPSGSGKSTLLSLIGGISSPLRGSISVLGEQISGLRQSRKDKFRADHIGFIFQQFNLLPYLSVVDNVVLACKFSVLRRRKVLAQGSSLDSEAKRLLEQMQFPMQRVNDPVSALSVGQQQRVAVARSLIGSPEIIVADEPTSALDAETRERFVQLLLSECERAGASILFVSHDPALEPFFDRSIHLNEINRATCLPGGEA